MTYIQVSEIITGQEPLNITRGGQWHEVVLLSQGTGQVDAKIKKQRRIDFATRTFLKAMLSAQVQDKAKHLGSWWK